MSADPTHSPPTPAAPLAARHGYLWAAVGLFLVSIAATLWAWSAARKATQQLAELRFTQQMDLVQNRATERLQDCELALWSGRGLFEASRDVTREEWRVFATALLHGDLLAGVQGVGFTQRIAAPDLPAHTAAIRAEGFPDYTVHPENARAEYHSIVYLEPFRDRNLRAFGYDMMTESTRRLAMETARDTGTAAISNRVVLVQEIPGEPTQSGFLIYVPVYRPDARQETVAQRRENLRGFVYSAVRAGDFFDRLMFIEPLGVGVQIHSEGGITPATLVYDSMERPKAETVPPGFAPRHSAVRTCMFLGRTWTLVFHSLPSFEAAHRSPQATQILFFGTVFSFLVTGIVMVQGSRSRALVREAGLARELRAARDELEHKVQIRTTQLAQTKTTVEQELAKLVRMESELREVNRRYDELVRRIPVGIYSFHARPGGTPEFTYVSPAFCRILGISAESVLHDANAAFALAHPEDRPSLIAENDRAVARQAMFRWEGRFIVDGNIRWIEIESSPVTRPEGGLVWNGVVMDTTGRKEAEAALRRLSDYARSLIEASLDPLVTINAEGVITDVNEASILATGVPREQLVGTDFSNYFTDPAKAREGYQRVFAEGLVRDYPLAIRHVSGRVMEVLYNASVYRDDAGRVLGVFAAARDVTEQRRLLRQSEENARTKSDLLREVNHRVSNNLTSILGLIVSETRGLDAASRGVAKPALDRLSQRIYSLLSVHRYLADTQWSPVRLDQLAEQITRAALAADADRRDTTVTITPTAIHVSPRQASNLALIFNELTTNAVKYAHVADRPLAITITIASEPGFVQLSFADNGAGLPPEVLSGARYSVGFSLVQQLVTDTLRGTLQLANTPGAMITLRFRTEDPKRT